MADKRSCEGFLSDMLGKETLIVSRGSAAIRMALSYARSLGCEQLYVPDQGGWHTYRKDGEKAGFLVETFPTDLGRFGADTVAQFAEGSVLLVHALAGYVFPLDMDAIYAACKVRDIFVITDISGAIGDAQLHVGDVLISSFGKWKPLEYGQGGCISASIDVLEHVKSTERFSGNISVDFDWDELEEKIKNLQQRRAELINICDSIAKSLKMPRLYYEHGRSIVLIVPFASEDEKNIILGFCEAHALPYTLCPREVRVLTDAVSIEVKRLQRWD